MDIKILPASKKISSESLKPISPDSFFGKDKQPEQEKDGGVYVTKKQLVTIQSKVIRIEKILGKENSMLKKQSETTRRQTENKKRKAKEDRFEKKPSATKEAKDGPSMPRIGFFERVKNFIGKVLLGFLAMKLLPFLPDLLRLIPKLQGIVDWVADFGIGLLDALGGFLEGAYALRDKTLEFIENIGGEGAVNAFLKFEKAIEATLTALIAIGGIMAIAAKGGGPLGGGLGGGFKRGFDKFGRRVSPSVMQRYYRRFGRDKFIERFGTKNLRNLPNKLRRSALTKGVRRGVSGILGRGGMRTVLGGLRAMKRFISPIVKRIPFIGALIDFALNVFVFKEPIGKAAFKAIGAGLGTWIGGVIGSLIPIPLVGTAIGAFVGGVGGDAVGGMIYDMIFGGKKDTDDPVGDKKDKDKDKEKETLSNVRPRQRSARSTYTTGPAGGSGDQLTMARNLMRDLKITAAQAAGIVGNMIAESGVENGRPQNTPAGTKGPLVVDGVTGYGIVQWTSKGRQQALYDYAKSKGHDMSKPLTMDIEYQFFLKEFRGDYGYVLDQIRNAKTVKESSTIFMQQYEVPAGYRTNAKIMERYYASQPVFEKLESGQGTATEGDGTFIAPTPVAQPDLSPPDSYGSDGVEQGDASEAGKRILKDFPQIQSRAHDGQIFASGLGYYLKKSGAGRPGRGDYGDPRGGDMEHPDHGGVVASHRGAGHKLGVALDLGAYSATMGSYQDDQKNLWPHIAKYLKKYGLNKEPYTPQVLHGRGESFTPVGPGSGADGGHDDHFHVEFQRAHAGKRTGGMGAGRINGDEFLTNVRNTERILDADTSRALGDTLLQRLDDASTPAGVQKVLSQALGISERASYEDTGATTIIHNKTVMPVDNSRNGGKTQINISSSGRAEDFGEILAAGQ